MDWPRSKPDPPHSQSEIQGISPVAAGCLGWGEHLADCTLSPWLYLPGLADVLLQSSALFDTNPTVITAPSSRLISQRLAFGCSAPHLRRFSASSRAHARSNAAAAPCRCRGCRGPVFGLPSQGKRLHHPFSASPIRTGSLQPEGHPARRPQRGDCRPGPRVAGHHSFKIWPHSSSGPASDNARL